MSQNCDCSNVTMVPVKGLSLGLDLSGVECGNGGSGGGSGIDFSVDEQDTGIKWLDGRTVYQKTITVSRNLNPGTEVFIPHSIANLDLVVDFNCTGFDKDLYFLNIPHVGGDNKSDLHFYVTKTNIAITPFFTARNGDFYFTLRYVCSNR